MSKHMKQIFILLILVLTSCAQHGIQAWNIKFDDPVDIVGLTSDQINSFLGAPTLVRAEASAEMWQYRGKGCTLFVYLSLDEAGAVKADYAETRAKGDETISFRDCAKDALAHKI